MALSDAGGIPKRVIVIQLVIITGLVIFAKVYLPRMEKQKAAAQLEARETRIEDFFKSIVAENSGAEASTESLRSTPSVEEVEQAVGAPDTSTTDFAGGLHLTWIGTRHSLEGSFNHGRLYFLTLTNRRTGQSVKAS